MITWTDDPSLFAKEKVLGIPEPPVPIDPEVAVDLCLSQEDLIPEEVQILEYPVFIHVLRVEDTETWIVLSDGGGGSSSDDINVPDRDPGGGPSRHGPLSRFFSCRKGVADGDELQGPWPAGGGDEFPPTSAAWAAVLLHRRWLRLFS